MRLNEWVLYNLAKRWPSPVKKRLTVMGEDVASEEYHMNYALHRQYLYKVKQGIPFDFWDKAVLEVGCGHGGISAFLAVNGAKRVVGIDLNTYDLNIANKFQVKLEERLGTKLPMEFMEMNAYEMTFPGKSFDIVLADNVFEHFMEPGVVMKQANSVLKDGGLLVVPTFNSIYSKYGIHLKYGLKMPWANIIFSERTICNVMYRLALDNPLLFEVYGGLKDRPTTIKDLRKYKDLNSMTHRRFKKLAKENGFEIVSFHVNVPGRHFIRVFNSFLQRIPVIKDSLVGEIVSTNAMAILIKSSKV